MGRVTLKSRNIRLIDYRTSIRLETEIWDALKEVSKLENCKVHDICCYVAIDKDPHASLTSAIRVFLIKYFQAAATEEGHKNACHGHLKTTLLQRLRAALLNRSGNGATSVILP